MLILSHNNNIACPIMCLIFPFRISLTLNFLLVIRKFLTLTLTTRNQNSLLSYREKYNIYQGIVAERLEEVVSGNSLEEVLSLKVYFFEPIFSAPLVLIVLFSVFIGCYE